MAALYCRNGETRFKDECCKYTDVSTVSVRVLSSDVQSAFFTGKVRLNVDGLIAGGW